MLVVSRIRFFRQASYAEYQKAYQTADKIELHFQSLEEELNKCIANLFTSAPKNSPEIASIVTGLQIAQRRCIEMQSLCSTESYNCVMFYYDYLSLSGYFMSTGKIRAGVELLRFWGTTEDRWEDFDEASKEIIEFIGRAATTKG